MKTLHAVLLAAGLMGELAFEVGERSRPCR